MRTRFTRADYARLPEGFPAQLVDGDLVKEPAPSYGHQTVVTHILGLLLPLVGHWRVVPAPIDVPIDEHNVFQPDVVVLRKPLPIDVHDVDVPLVAFEVVSPDDRRRVLRKKDRLLAAGTEEVWLVDPRARRIEVHERSGVRVAEGDAEIRSGVVEGFGLRPSVLFAPPPV